MANHDSTQPEVHDELSAYLDGELDAPGVQRVEERLARDPAYRAELNRMERAWHLLDDLPRASVDENFTKTTIEMVALSASQEAEAITRELPKRRRRQRMIAGTAMAVAVAAGFAIGSLVWSDPNEQLLADLPVLEDLDLYYQADEIEFLRMLVAQHVFDDADEVVADVENAPEGLPAPAAADAQAGTAVPARRARIAAMEPSQQQELLRKYEQFAALPAAEQDRLRQLQAEISADRQSEKLHQALARYHEWLKTISPSERAMLAEAAPEQRIKQLEYIQRRQRADEQLELLSRHDRRHITGWIYGLVKEHRDDILASMSPEDRRRFNDRDEPTQQRWLIYRTFRGSRRDKDDSRVTQADIDQLRTKLSDEARAELAKATNLEEQRRIVGMWVYGTLHRSESWRGGRMNPLVGEELLQFLQNEVSPARREELLQLPREEMLSELRKMYFEQGHGPGGPRPGGFRGPDRPHNSDRPRSRGPRGPEKHKDDKAAPGPSEKNDPAPSPG